MPDKNPFAQILRNSRYADLCDLVFRVTHEFSKRYAIPFDDLVGPAHVAYVKACDRYDPTRGARLSSWVYTKVWYSLMSFSRKEIQYRTHMGQGTEVLEPASDETFDPTYEEMRCCYYRHTYEDTTPPNICLLEMESELSPRANEVVRLLFDVRKDFALMFSWRTAKAKRVTRHQMLLCLREHLHDLGWDKPTIDHTFDEIRLALAP